MERYPYLLAGWFSIFQRENLDIIISLRKELLFLGFMIGYSCIREKSRNIHLVLI
jgi:hypothetical protein